LVSEYSFVGKLIVEDELSARPVPPSGFGLMCFTRNQHRNHPYNALIRGPSRRLQTRISFKQHLVAIEAWTYMKLKDHQRINLPCCYGAYTLEFPERELSEHKLVNILLFKRIRGKRATEVPP
jgi:hypothetical protein